MFGALGAAPASTALTFVSKAAAENGLKERLGLRKQLVPVQNTRALKKTDMVHNDLLPNIEVDPETYEVRVDGELVTSEPATELPLAQRYFLF
jgi:urease subunit alpha